MLVAILYLLYDAVNVCSYIVPVLYDAVDVCSYIVAVNV